MSSKVEFWKPHLAAWNGSGLSQAEYCRRHGLSIKSFAYWRRRLGRTEGVAGALVPIVVADAPTSDERIEVQLPNGLQVRLPIDTAPARVVPMIRALCSC